MGIASVRKWADAILSTGRRSDNKREEIHGGISLFQKKEIIYSETIGVCVVDDIVKLADNKKDTYNYYLLRSVFDKTKKAYIPVENHTVQLRGLITLQEAQALCGAADYEEKSEQVKGEAAYVIEKAQQDKNRKRAK